MGSTFADGANWIARIVCCATETFGHSCFFPVIIIDTSPGGEVNVDEPTAVVVAEVWVDIKSGIATSDKTTGSN